MRARLISYILLFAALYVAGYLLFRVTQQEVWAEDGKTYVILPSGPGVVLYYLWRPLMYVDGTLTGMAFHIGPHNNP